MADANLQLSLRKAVRTQINKCEECDGEGSHILESKGGFNLTEKCISCNGQGYIEPLEFGCEVEKGGKIYTAWQKRSDGDGVIIVSQENVTTLQDGDTFENLGKPLKYNELLRALGERCERFTAIKFRKDDTLLYHDNLTIHSLDLTKDPEEQDEEVIKQLLEILS